MHPATTRPLLARWGVVLIALVQSACSDFGPVRAQEADPELHPALVAHLAGLQDDDFVPLVIHSAETSQLGPTDRSKLLGEAVGSTRRERRLDGRRRLVQALRAKAAETQVGLLTVLEAGSANGSVRRLRSLWVLGAVGCEIHKSLLVQLLGDPAAMANVAVEGIRLDLPRRVFGRAASVPSPAATAWGVQKIGADTLHATGVTGAGAVVAVIDSGFELNHPDIKDRIWKNTGEESDGIPGITLADQNGDDTDGNGCVDDLAGWDFADWDGNVADTNPHGTEVAGIVAGTGDGGTQTGVAPGALLMLLKVGAAATGVTQGEVWQALDYALVEEADIVNLSLNWSADYGPDYAGWRKEIDILSEAGVLVVAITGNDADQRFTATGILEPPLSVTTPGRVPSALTVGATDQADVLWYDDSAPGLPPMGSNTGPVTWQDVAGFADYPHPPGLMKPDVVAPGVDIDVPYLPLAPNLYLMDDGTSFAAPHVAGLAALLLEMDPELGPYELRYLIEESAVDLTPAGPEVTHGWGRVDAAAAAALMPIEPAAYDLAITATDAQWTTVDIWVDNDDDGLEDTPIGLVENHLYARVRNVGGQVVSNVRLEFYYADVATIGIDGFDPNADADPQDGDFTHIGGYTVPLLGPAGSGHDTAIGLASWEIPEPTSDHWCVGVAARAVPPNDPEADVADNIAFRNFFELFMMTSASLEFRLAPPPRRKREPFDFEIRKPALPERARLSLVVGPELAPIFDRAWRESRLGPPPPGRRPPTAAAYYKLSGEVVRFRGLRSPDGDPMRVGLAVHLPTEVALPPDARVVMSVLDAEEREVGGLTIKLVRSPSSRRGGPYPPKPR